MINVTVKRSEPVKTTLYAINNGEPFITSSYEDQVFIKEGTLSAGGSCYLCLNIRDFSKFWVPTNVAVEPCDLNILAIPKSQ